MRQAIRALSWATYIFWIILVFFTATAIYSAFQLRLGFGEPSTAAVGGNLTVSLPFSIANGGFYDISKLNLTTLIMDNYGFRISGSSTFVQVIPHGGNVSVTHHMSIDISQMTTESLSYLLLNDSDLNMNLVLKLNYANAVPFKISTNLTMPWGAPLSNLTVGQYTLTSTGIALPVSFENHSFIGLNGTMRLEILDNGNQIVGEGTTNIDAPSESGFETVLDITISGDPRNVRTVRLYIETSVLNYGPIVMTLVRK